MLMTECWRRGRWDGCIGEVDGGEVVVVGVVELVERCRDSSGGGILAIDSKCSI